MSSGDTDISHRGWTTLQVYLTAAGALLIGISAGYGLHVSRPTGAPQVVKSAPSPRTVTKTAEAETSDLLLELKRDPNNPALLAKVGYVYYSMREFPKAADYYKRSVDAKDDPIVRVELGRAYYYAGDSDRALTAFDAVVKADPSNADALFNAGVIRWKSKLDAEGAIANWQQLLRTHPDHPRKQDIEKLILQAQLHKSKSLLSPK